MSMELPSKTLVKKVLNARPEIEENLLIVLDKSIDEKTLALPLQTNNKQSKVAVTFFNWFQWYFQFYKQK